MLQAILAFTLFVFFLSLLNMVVPLSARVNGKQWENQTYKQRFCSSFFPVVIVFILIMVVNDYRRTHTPSFVEEMLENGQIEYIITHNEKFEYADLLCEIKKDSSQEDICRIITDICKAREMGSDSLNVYYDGERYYVIMDDKVRIGKVTTSELRFGTLLVFTWSR